MRPVHSLTKRNSPRLACGFPGTPFAMSTGLAGGVRSGNFRSVLANFKGWSSTRIITRENAQNTFSTDMRWQ